MPCKDCANRCVGCHGSCSKYIQACKEREAFKDKVRKNKSQDNQFMSYIRDRHFQIMHREASNKKHYNSLC